MNKTLIAFVLLIVPLVLIGLGVQPVEGCPPEGKRAGCYGPIGTYWTIYGAQLAFQSPAFTSGAIAGVLITILGLMRKWNKTIVILLSMAAFLWTFAAMVYFNPVIIQY